MKETYGALSLQLAPIRSPWTQPEIFRRPLCGPYAAQWLGDFGADVIKVEAPGGDSTRYTGPTPEPGMAPIFMGVNRNKRSIVLDLKHPDAVETLLQLVDEADVLLHSVRPQKMAKLGLDSSTLLARNPRLIYAGFHGFERGGPYGGRPVYDDIIQGLSGAADLMARKTGSPHYFPTIFADKTTGLIGAIAILGAIVGRQRTGKGSVVEIPMFEAMAAFNLVEHLYSEHFIPPTADTGYPRVMAASRRPFATADGHICMMPYTDAHWRDFFAEVGAPHIAVNPRFASITSCTNHIDELYGTVASFVMQRSTNHWTAVCERLQIPAAAVMSIDELPSDEHLKAISFFADAHDPQLGQVRFPGVPVRFDGERPPVRFPPRLGEHTAEILSKLGASTAQAWCQPNAPTKKEKSHL